MKKNLLFTAAIFLIGTFTFVSCSGPEESEATEQEQQTSCFYSYNESASELVWTAYKTNDKVAVPGSFDKITVSSEKAEDPKDVLESIEFTIETGSVNTNNADRDAKISKHFFETFMTQEIKGKFRSLREDGKAVISLVMHGIELDIEGEYSLVGKEFTFKSSIDVSKWNGMEAINALNTECKDLHTGADGESKLWSEVGLSFKTTLNSDCD